jgi:hypothetical protein
LCTDELGHDDGLWGDVEGGGGVCRIGELLRMTTSRS